MNSNGKMTYNFFTLFTVSGTGHACIQNTIYLMNQYFESRNLESKTRVKATLERVRAQLEHTAKNLSYLQSQEKNTVLLKTNRLNECRMDAVKNGLCKNSNVWNKIETGNLNYILVESINQVTNIWSHFSKVQDGYEACNKEEEGVVISLLFLIDEIWLELQSTLKILAVIFRYIKEDGAGNLLIGNTRSSVLSGDRTEPRKKSQFTVVK